jgi:uncharacterized protein YjbI with pentapeptide repeats
MWPFTKPKPTPPGVTIKNFFGVWRLENVDLKGRHWAHADLSGMSLAGANCEGIELFGARLVRTSFCRANLKNANLAYATVGGASFQRAELDNADLLHTNVKLQQLDGAIITPARTIPGIRVVE